MFKIYITTENRICSCFFLFLCLKVANNNNEQNKSTTMNDIKFDILYDVNFGKPFFLESVNLY